LKKIGRRILAAMKPAGAGVFSDRKGIVKGNRLQDRKWGGIEVHVDVQEFIGQTGHQAIENAVRLQQMMQAIGVEPREAERLIDAVG
jgi:hypothetical protein